MADSVPNKGLAQLFRAASPSPSVTGVAQAAIPSRLRCGAWSTAVTAMACRGVANVNHLHGILVHDPEEDFEAVSCQHLCADVGHICLGRTVWLLRNEMGSVSMARNTFCAPCGLRARRYE